MNILRNLLPLFLLALIIGCKDNPADEPFLEIVLEFETLAKDMNGFAEAANHVIRNDIEYEHIYGQISNGFMFGNDMIIVVYKGSLSHGGNKYEITQILERETDIEVTVEFTPCLTACPTVVSKPYHMVKTAWSTKPVTFTEIVK